MGERDEPDLDEVREALREHDERARLNEAAEERARAEEEDSADERDGERQD